ncbi:MAG: hypothetical protein LIP02_01480 [Bacteroidales bacterium]|nr:hypothetical protein [Bacteroidales bacterium]
MTLTTGKAATRFKFTAMRTDNIALSSADAGFTLTFSDPDDAASIVGVACYDSQGNLVCSVEDDGIHVEDNGSYYVGSYFFSMKGLESASSYYWVPTIRFLSSGETYYARDNKVNFSTSSPATQGYENFIPATLDWDVSVQNRWILIPYHYAYGDDQTVLPHNIFVVATPLDTNDNKSLGDYESDYDITDPAGEGVFKLYAQPGMAYDVALWYRSSGEVIYNSHKSVTIAADAPATSSPDDDPDEGSSTTTPPNLTVETLNADINGSSVEIYGLASCDQSGASVELGFLYQEGGSSNLALGNGTYVKVDAKAYPSTTFSYSIQATPQQQYAYRAVIKCGSQTLYGDVLYFTAGSLNDEDPDQYAVDLGLSVKWSSVNFGASGESGYGSFVPWGTTSLSNCDYSADWYDTNFTGTFRDLVSLEWSGDWRLPTSAEFQELIDNCVWQWTEVNGVRGMKFTSKINERSIFLPAAGNMYEGKLYSNATGGCYWSNDPGEQDDVDGDTVTNSSDLDALRLHFTASEEPHLESGKRFFGRSIRPVCPK